MSEFKCDYCPSVLRTKANLNNHMKNNKTCLKKRGITRYKKISCMECGYINITSLLGHVCRSEGIEMVNKIKMLNITIEKLNNKIEKNIDTNIEKNKKLKSTIEKKNKKIIIMKRDYRITINNLNVRIENYENKIATKYKNFSNHNIINHNTINNNNIKMLIEKLVPPTENERNKYVENAVTKELMLNGLGSVTKDNNILYTGIDTGIDAYENNIRYDDVKYSNERVIIPQICKWGNKLMSKIKSGIGEKDIKSKSNILYKRLKVNTK